MKLIIKISWCIAGLFGAFLNFVPVRVTEFGWMSTIMPVFIALPTIFLAFRYKISDFVKIFVIMSAYAFLIEGIGLMTGFPYGQFHYLELAGWRMGGFLPVSLPFAWVPLGLAAYSVARRWRLTGWAGMVLIGMMTLLCFDFLIDPAAVKFGLWEYVDKNGFFEVPWSNFLGWIISGSVAMIILNWLFDKEISENGEWALRASAGCMIGFWLGYWFISMQMNHPLWVSLDNLQYLLPSLFGIIAIMVLLLPPKEGSIFKNK